MKDGGPAFPHAHEDYPFQHGMSLRDYFAAKAMAAWIQTIGQNEGVTDDNIARFAYEAADAMLKAREAA